MPGKHWEHSSDCTGKFLLARSAFMLHDNGVFANNLINELMGRNQRLLRECTNE